MVILVPWKVNPYNRRIAPVLKISDGCRFIQFQALHFASNVGCTKCSQVQVWFAKLIGILSIENNRD